MFVALFIVLLFLYTPLAHATSLCQTPQHQLAGCPLENGKLVSICKGSNDPIYRYGLKGNIELSLTQMDTTTQRSAGLRAASDAYTFNNGRYRYQFYSSLSAHHYRDYLEMELQHRGYRLPLLESIPIKGHHLTSGLTVSHQNRGELLQLRCVNDHRFYRDDAASLSPELTHILTDITDNYHEKHIDNGPSRCKSGYCVRLYTNFAQTLLLVHFVDIKEQHQYSNDSLYLIERQSGQIKAFTAEQLKLSNPTPATVNIADKFFLHQAKNGQYFDLKAVNIYQVVQANH